MTKVVTPQGHGLGWVKDSPDQRDFDVYELIQPVLSLPTTVDLRLAPQMPEIWNQGQLGSCTAHSVGASYVFGARKSGFNVPDPSRLFIYFEERKLEGTTATDSGALIRDGFKVLANIGVPPETDWPYDIAKFALAPPAVADADAINHKASSYYAVLQNENAIKQVLAAGFPVSFGFSVYESFESPAVAASGVVPMPKHGEQLLGGHAVLIVGYYGEYFIVRNSWGTDWGKSGYFMMPIKYVIDASLASDFWVCKVAD